MGFHKDIALGQVHQVCNWHYADAAARTGASGFVTADLYKFALQLDDNSIWMLTATTPTWSAVVAPSGFTNLTSFVDQTAWRLFYSDGDGDVTELALGADGTFLKSNGATVAPSFATPAGAGTVTSVAVSGSDGIEIDSGSPITTSGTIAIGVNASTLKTHLGLDAVENTALSTWAGSAAIVTLGTIGTGTWQGDIIGPAYLGTGSSISTKFLRGDGTWQTDIAGNAATVTTNANLTGHVTSTGNAAVLGSFTVAELNAALSDGDAATVAYADSLVVGLLDDRGNHDASSNSWPSSGGSGSAGAILKGDLWTISVGGTLGSSVVTPGDTIRALVDTPGTTASNWAISETNIGYAALNAALPSAHIYVGNGAGTGTAVTVSGDITLSNAGVAAIPTSVISAAARTMLDDATVGDMVATLGLGAVENTALSTWAGTSSITTVGTIGTGTWQGTPIGDSYISSAATWNAKQAGDATLTAFAAMTIAADSLTIGTGADAFTQVTFAANTFPAKASTGDLVAKPITDFALSVLDDADAATARGTLGVKQQSKSITIPDPTNAEDLTLFFANEALTITKMVAVVRGSTPSATWTIRKGSDRSATGTEVVTSGTTTTSATSGSVVTSFDSAGITADDFVWLETTATSGTVDELHVTIYFN